MILVRVEVERNTKLVVDNKIEGKRGVQGLWGIILEATALRYEVRRWN